MFLQWGDMAKKFQPFIFMVTKKQKIIRLCLIPFVTHLKLLLISIMSRIRYWFTGLRYGFTIALGCEPEYF